SQGAVRVYDFDLQKNITRRVIGDLALTEPVAATYHAADDAYYILDRTSTLGIPVMRLVRMTKGQTLERVAEWPRAGIFSAFALTSGTDGAIVLSASRKDSHAIALLGWDQGDVRLQGLFFGSGGVAAPAKKTPLGLEYARQDADGVVPVSPSLNN